MSEQVYQRDSPPVSGEHSNSKPLVETPPVSGEHQRRMSQESFASSKMSYYGYGYNQVPNPGSYVVQIPKDQIYRVPPPENAHKFNLYSKKQAHKHRCRCCMCSTLACILVLIVLLGVAIGVTCLIFNPKAPTYSIERLQIKGVNMTSQVPTLSPVFNVTVKTENQNGKIGIHYDQGSEINIYHDGVNLCDGELPAFFQPPNSVTVFSTELNGAGIVLSKPARAKLLTEQKNSKVPLELDIKIPVKIKIGSVKTWTMTVNVKCDVTVNALTADAKVMSKKCKVSAKPW